MHRLALIPFVVLSIAACGDTADVPSPTPPAAPTVTNNAPASTPAATPAPAPAPVAASAPLTKLDAPVDASSLTCASLPQITPQARLSIQELHGPMGPIKPIDVFALVHEQADIFPNDAPTSMRSITLFFSEQAQECALFKAGLVRQDANTFQIGLSYWSDAKELPPAFVPSTYTDSGQRDLHITVGQDTGQRCATPGVGDPATGTNGRQLMSRGTFTITALTDTQVEGTVDVIDDEGKPTKLTFAAPICITKEAPTKYECCDAAP